MAGCAAYPFFHRAGAQLIPNPLYARPATTFRGGQPAVVPWWARKWAISLWLYLCLLLRLVAAAYVFETGRARMQCVCTAIAVGLASALWSNRGGDITWFAVVSDEAEQDGESEVEDESQSDASSTPATPAKDQTEAWMVNECWLTGWPRWRLLRQLSPDRRREWKMMIRELRRSALRSQRSPTSCQATAHRELCRRRHIACGEESLQPCQQESSWSS